MTGEIVTTTSLSCKEFGEQRRTATAWLDYFNTNGKNLLPIPWDSPHSLSSHERAILDRSLKIFQLGESSEGHYLMKAARAYFAHSGDAVFIEVLKLFIFEEQRHARDLARFMKQHHMLPIRTHWADTAFRKLRRLLNLEMSLTVLLTAEIVGLLYSRALSEVTQSPVLQQLSRQIRHDEQEHIRFQSVMLGKLRQKRSPWLLALICGIHKLFLRATLGVVWLDHAPVFRAGGYSFRRFCSEACFELETAIKIM